MKWIAFSFFSIAIVLSILLIAGFEFIEADLDAPSTAQVLPTAAR